MRLFAQKGYAATSTKEICGAARADIAAIHYHFKSKENLYRHIIEQFASDHMNKLCQILRPPKTRDEFVVRLETFLQVSVDSIMQQPELAKMILRDMELMTDICKDVFEDTFMKLHKALISFFTSAKEGHLLRPGVDPGLATLSFNNQLLFLSQGGGLIKALHGFDIADNKFRERWLAHVMDALCFGFLE